MVDALRGWEDESEWRELEASRVDRSPDITVPVMMPPDNSMAAENMAPNEEQEFSLDRKILSLLYENLGDNFLHKGDYILSEKMFVQSDICYPNNDTILDKIKYIRSERENSKAGISSNASPEKKFDFLCVPIFRCASSHYSALLPLHPEVYVVPTPELDAAVENASEDQLLNEHWRRIMCRRPDLRVGLVQHSFIAGLTGPPDIARRLSGIVAGDGFIQGVRDPFELLRSIYNHRLISGFGGSYKFNFINPNTPFSENIIEIKDLTGKYSDPGYYTNNSFSIDSQARQQILDKAVSHIRFHKAGKTYADFFDGWRAIDFPHASRDVDGGRMAEVFKAIGVNADYKNPLYSTPHANQIHRLFVQNFINLRVFGTNITLFLGIFGQSVFSNLFDFVELCWMEPDDQCREVGIHQPLCLCMPTNYWSEERREICHRLIHEGIAERLMRDHLVPIWIANYKAWKKTIHPFLIHEFDQAKRAELFDEFREDLSEFLKVHGKFANTWPSVSEFL